MMTPRERWLAAVRLQPVDRLPFWPKLGETYPAAQAPPFRGMPVDAIHQWVGSDQHVGVECGIRDVRRTTRAETALEGDERVTVFHTPRGTARERLRWDEYSGSWHPVEFPIKDREDLAVMRAWYEDVRAEPDHEALEEVRSRCREIGERAVRVTNIGESPLMLLVEWLAGVGTAHLLLADCPDEVEALFAAIHRDLLRRTEIIAERHPADLSYLTENTSTTLISPDQYRRYCLRHTREYAEILRAAGRHLVLHMCGHLKALLPDLATLPAAAFEAFTSPPVGNTTLQDGRSACPRVCLVGGTNAVLWTRPVEEIILELDAHLAALPHHRGLVITSAGVLPPCCPPETIKAVADWVKAYAARQ